ncbi:MAG: hypothetical protein AB8H80_15780 [Planctomycetota bacterium]
MVDHRQTLPSPERQSKNPLVREARPALVAVAALAALTLAPSCTPIVRYTSDLVDDSTGRSWFTRFPSAVGGTVGFALGIPIDFLAVPGTFLVYRSQPKETRDPLSVFLFPSFVLWKIGALIGAPFDAVEWVLWRGWQEPPAITPEEREIIERKWDAREFSVYPVTPIYPR